MKYLLEDCNATSDDPFAFVMCVTETLIRSEAAVVAVPFIRMFCQNHVSSLSLSGGVCLQPCQQVSCGCGYEVQRLVIDAFPSTTFNVHILIPISQRSVLPDGVESRTVRHKVGVERCGVPLCVHRRSGRLIQLPFLHNGHGTVREPCCKALVRCLIELHHAIVRIRPKGIIVEIDLCIVVEQPLTCRNGELVKVLGV